MATPYTSARNGEWNASVTDTWGQGVGVYPNTAADVVNIGHTVTYNVVSTAELGLITITTGGILTFSTAMSTKLTLGHVDIAINNGGELRVGASGAIIPKTYLAELIWNTTADYVKGINVVSGGKFTIYGDVDYYGSILATQLYSDWNGTDTTIYLKGDLSSKWLNGQRLYIHKGRAYNATTCTATTGFAIVSINGTVTWDGTKSTVPITLINVPNTATSFLANGDVLNISRNVYIYKLGASENVNTAATNRPWVRGTGTLTNCVLNGGAFLGVNWNLLATMSNVVLRNYYNNFPSGCYLSNVMSIFSSTSFFAALSGLTISGGYLISSVGPFGYADNVIVTNVRIYGNDAIVSSTYPLTGALLTTCYLYSNGAAVNNILGILKDCYVGYDEFANVKANLSDFAYSKCGSLLINCKLPSSPAYSGRNLINYLFKHRFEHYKQVANDHYIADAFGDLNKVSSGWTGTPPSGATNCLKATTSQSNLSTTTYLDLITQGQFRIWQVAGTVVYKVYIQNPTANSGSTALTSADIALYAEWLDNTPAGTGHTSTTASDQSISQTDDWTQYLSVSVTTAVAGWVTLYLRLMKYVAATDVFYVDPGILADSAVKMGDWSFGELSYVDATTTVAGSGGLLINPGLSGGLR